MDALTWSDAVGATTRWSVRSYAMRPHWPGVARQRGIAINDTPHAYGSFFRVPPLARLRQAIEAQKCVHD